MSELVVGNTPDLNKILGPLQDRLRELETYRSEMVSAHHERLRSIDREINKTKGVLKAAFPDQFATPTNASAKPKRPGQRTAHGTATGYGITEERLAAGERFIREWLSENDIISQTDFRLQTGADQSRASAIFMALRERNVLRMVKQEGSRKYYRLTAQAQQEEQELAKR